MLQNLAMILEMRELHYLPSNFSTFLPVNLNLGCKKIINFMNARTLTYLQAARAGLTSSSYFLHFPKVAVHFFNAVAKFLAFLDTKKLCSKYDRNYNYKSYSRKI